MDPAGANVPFLQIRHATCPLSLLKAPIGQSSQPEEAAWGEYMPGSHMLQFQLAFQGLKSPAAQATHADAFSSE